MFKYTFAVLHDTIEDFKKLVKAFGIIGQILTIIYLAYSTACVKSTFILDAILLLFAVIYFIVYLVLSNKQKKGTKEKLKKIKKNYKTSKWFIRLFALIVSLYGLFMNTQDFSVITLVLNIFTLFLLILDVVFDLIRKIIQKRIEYLKYAFERDVQPLSQAKNKAENIIRKVTGYEEQQLSEIPTNVLEYLDIVAGEYEQHKIQKKIINKHQKFTKIKQFFGNKKAKRIKNNKN